MMANQINSVPQDLNIDLNTYMSKYVAIGLLMYSSDVVVVGD